VNEKVPAVDILHNGLIKGMSVVGERFKNNEFYVPEVLIAARAMKAGMEIIRPLLLEAKVEPLGRAAIGTVKGDLHDIGKNLVAMMLEGAGFEIIDLGIDVSPEKFIEAVKGEEGAVDLHVRAADDDDAVHEDHDRGGEGVGHAGEGQGDDRRGPGDAGLRERDRGRRLRPDAASAADKAKELLGK